jgi:hypothetical protein
MKPKHLTGEEYTSYLKRIGVDNQKITGDERDTVWNILQQLEPIKSWSNQRTFTDEYKWQGNIYRVHHGLENEPVVELIKE